MSIDQKPPPTANEAPTTLVRALGLWDYTAIGINIIIGGSIFLIGAPIAALLGSWSPLAFLLVGAMSLLIGITFAEVSTRFSSTGGPYTYARVALGRFAGFEVAWMMWFTRVTSQASLQNGLILALGFYFPWVTVGWGRAIGLALMTAALAAINIRGIRQTAFAIKLLSVIKLLPVVLFIVIGFLFIEPSRWVPQQPFSWQQLSAAAMILVYSFGGYEVVPVNAGEGRNPRRDAPLAVIASILCVVSLLTLVQFVLLGTLPNLAASTTPVADASFLIVGSGGALFIAVGSMFSIFGCCIGTMLTASRLLFALADDGDLPTIFGRLHRVYRTPVFAVVFSSVLVLLLALTGSFVTLAIASSLPRLLTYILVCISTLILRRPRYEGVVGEARFRAPLGPVIPLAALFVAGAILIGVSVGQVLGGAMAIVAGAALYLLATRTPKPAAADRPGDGRGCTH